MKKAIILSGLLLTLTASFAAAAAGINLANGDCSAGGLVNAPNNLCTSNTGLALNLIVSVTPPAGMNNVVAVDGLIDVQTDQPALSPWWSLDGCRAVGALSFDAGFLSGPFNCNDFWAGGATPGGGITPVHTAANRFQIIFTAATSYETAMDPQAEHYTHKILITKSKSVSTGACAGCTDAACLVLNRLVVIQPAGVGDAEITTPIVSNWVTYNGGVVGPGPNGEQGCPGATPSQNRTWGQVKSLYR